MKYDFSWQKKMDQSALKLQKSFKPRNNDSARIVLSIFPNPPIWVKENNFFKFILKDMA